MGKSEGTSEMRRGINYEQPACRIVKFCIFSSPFDTCYNDSICTSVLPSVHNPINTERISIKFDIGESPKKKKKVFGSLQFSYMSRDFTDYFIKWDCLRFWRRYRLHPCSTRAPKANSSAVHSISYYSLSSKNQ